MDFCAIDFGTSNSALALPAQARVAGLVALEEGEVSMPTAVFFFTDPAHGEISPRQHHLAGAPPCAYGRAALRAYVEGHGGRLMRSMKSILGSSLLEQPTDLGDGHVAKHLDVIAGYLRHLRRLGEAAAGAPLSRVLLGRPVFFVDDDADRDRQAQAALDAAARAAGFAEVRFQFEPIAAAFDYEQRARSEQLVLVVDSGGGTSDFAVVRVGPDRARNADRRGDILASYGVHVAGTDFDRHVELACVLPLFGYRGRGPRRPNSHQPGREVPSAVYFDLSTWHLINTVYKPQRVAELRAMRHFYADPAQHRRLMRVVSMRLGHDLVARCEAAKIEVGSAQRATIDLGAVEPGLGATLDAREAVSAIGADLRRIERAAIETVRRAGLAPQRIDALYFTGGSTGLPALTEQIAALFPAAQAVRGDRLSSVASGLGLHAARMFG